MGRARLGQGPGAARQGRKGGSGARRAGGAAKSAAAPAGGRNGATPPAAENMLQWAIRASGPIGFCLLSLSIYFTALVIRLFMEFRVSEAVPAALVDKLEAAIRDKKFQDAYDVCKDNDSFLARLVRTGIANLPNGRPEAKEAMEADGRRDRHQPGDEDQLSGDHRDLGADDRAGGDDLGDDHELSGDRHGRRRPAQARKGRRRDLDGALHHPRRGLALGPGDLLLRLLPQSHRPDDHGSDARRRSHDQFPGRGGQGGQGVLTEPVPAGDDAMAASMSSEFKAEPNLTPLLDVVFQLITFFMLVINFSSENYDQRVRLPVAESARPVEDEATGLGRSTGLERG